MLTFLYAWTRGGLLPRFAPDWRLHLLDAVVNLAWKQRRTMAPLVAVEIPAFGDTLDVGVN